MFVHASQDSNPRTLVLRVESNSDSGWMDGWAGWLRTRFWRSCAFLLSSPPSIRWPRSSVVVFAAIWATQSCHTTYPILFALLVCTVSSIVSFEMRFSIRVDGSIAGLTRNSLYTLICRRHSAVGTLGSCLLLLGRGRSIRCCVC